MTQPPDPQQPQWWQPQPNQPGQPAQAPAWQPEQQATGLHAGQWQQQNAEPGTGSYTGQWNQGQQPGTSGSFSGPWQPGAPAPWQPPSQPTPQQHPGTPAADRPAQGQPGQQFGGGFQPAQYGGLGAFTPEPAKKPKSKKPLLIAGAAVLVLVVGGGAAWLLGAFRGDVLEQQSLQDGVVKVLNENYGEPDVKNAQCPSNEAARNGTTFDCTVTIGGQEKKVTVRVLNDRPEYEVGAPH
ncbi:DUF4333 domain-containing protein [Amycolatopsis sp. FBCC-B4732]|uniref:DUF4333 domain-containing protein n=1 Tax=Amycolatopsis sp. FBCC-B4732 TaxID=3079339 RepID=UPI001FF6E68E|nr:DUF4333 domain-containing protein [Amycolatopsis sp. FBCC-B4732]UOX86574.1 DUF4333 domain-containing protein [Amycolatopsis sp. FBCC-B4732]